jgi:hypothetical protein
VSGAGLQVGTVANRLDERSAARSATPPICGCPHGTLCDIVAGDDDRAPIA